MADSEIIVDIFNYCVKINANLLKERDIEINPTVDTTNRVDTDVVMQENAPLRVSDQRGSTSLADLILSQVEIQVTTWKPDSTKIMRQLQDFKRLDKIFLWKIQLFLWLTVKSLLISSKLSERKRH